MAGAEEDIGFQFIPRYYLIGLAHLRQDPDDLAITQGASRMVLSLARSHHRVKQPEGVDVLDRAVVLGTEAQDLAVVLPDYESVRVNLVVTGLEPIMGPSVDRLKGDRPIQVRGLQSFLRGGRTLQALP